MILLLAYPALLLLLAFLLARRSDPSALGFLHPHCHAGGGGEKVLWAMVCALLRSTDRTAVIYTVDPHPLPQVLLQVQRQFGLDLAPLSARIQLVVCRLEFCTRPAPRLTMLLQVLFDLLFMVECLLRKPCRQVIDTTGLPFSALVRLLAPGVRVYSYVHYPFISAEMVQKVRDRVQDYNNQVAHSWTLTQLKVLYYQAIYRGYQLAGLLVSSAWANSTWTCRHMQAAWPRTPMELAYPPCSVPLLKDIPPKQNVLVSFAQFRPEKDHALQVRVYRRLRQETARLGLPCPEFYMLGSCRNAQDEALLAELEKQSQGLDIKFLKNRGYG
jgi:alpha-1,2-mannosyltransferase